MSIQKGNPAKVSLARITIDAPPSKVYEKLATVASWNNWHTSAWVLKSPNLEKLGPGDKFAYTAPFVLGNVHSQVEESAQGKSLEWSDRALFGLVSGQHKWHLQPQTKKFLGILGKTRTQVTLDQEITGVGQLLVSSQSMEKHGATWLVELKKAVEAK